MELESSSQSTSPVQSMLLQPISLTDMNYQVVEYEYVKKNRRGCGSLVGVPLNVHEVLELPPPMVAVRLKTQLFFHCVTPQGS